MACDSDSYTVLVLSVLTAAFDTVKTPILITPLNQLVGIRQIDLSFSNVVIFKLSCAPLYGVPQGSIFPALFFVFAAPLFHSEKTWDRFPFLCPPTVH